MPQPPTYPDVDIDVSMAEPPAWPKAVGTVSIILSGLYLTCVGVGLLYLLLLAPKLMKMAEQQMGGPAPAALMPGPAEYASMIVNLGWATILLIAGIATVSRKRVGRTLHLVYAAGAVLLIIVGTVLQIRHQAVVHEWAQQNAGDKWAKQADSPVGIVIGLAIAAFGMAYSLFLIIWFGVVKRAPDSMTGGFDELTPVA